MTTNVPRVPPTSDPLRDISADERLAGELAKIQARADLEEAKAAAGLLEADALRELRRWIDSRLPGGKPPEAQACASLSEQEARALRLIALGYSNKEVAAQMQVSVKTVETYKSRAMEKLHIRTRVQIVRYAIQQGWITHATA